MKKIKKNKIIKQVSKGSPTNASILIVDDEEDARTGLKKLLSKNYKLFEAADGEEALKIINDHKNIGVVLLDIIMPKYSGFDILRVIKKTKPRIKVIMVSSLAEIKNAIRAMEMGAFNYVTKPYNKEVLLHVINSALKQKYSAN